MRNKLSIIFLLFGGLFFVIGATFMSINNKSSEKKKEENPPTKKEVTTYMPVLYRVSDKDSSIYILPCMQYGDSKIVDIDTKIYDLLDYNDLVVEYDFSKYDELEYTKNFVLENEDYLENHIDEELNNKLFEFSNSHSKYVYDEFKHYNLGYNYLTIDNLAYTEAGLTTEGFLNDLIDKAKAYNEGKYDVLLTEKDLINDINKTTDETYISMINNTIDNFNNKITEYKTNYSNYLSGNAEELDKFYNSLDIENDYYNKVIVKRNELLLKKIKDYLKNDKNVLVVIDSMNTFGDSGVIELLTEAEYEISIEK